MAREFQSREMDFFEIRYYNPNRISLSLIGLWPYNTPKERFIRTAIVSFILLLLLILQITMMIKVNDIELLTEVVSNFFIYLIGVFIYYNSVFNISKISLLFELIKRDWLEPKATKQLEIMKEYAEIGRKYALTLFVSAYGLLFSGIIMSTAPVVLDIIFPLNTTRPRVLPFPIELFFDVQEHFFLALFISFLLLSSFCMVSVSNYMMFMVGVQYICGMFRVVGSMLDDAIDAEMVSIRASHDSEARAYEMIVRSIKYHNRALEFDSIFNSIFENCLVIVLSMTLIFLMTAFLRLFQNDAFVHEHMKETVLSVLNIIFNCATLYIMSYMGQKIIDHSVSLFDKAYDVPWYVFSNCKQSQMLLWFVMMRSLKPCCIMIANFVTLSLKLSASVVQTALSYAMIIYSIR